MTTRGGRNQLFDFCMPATAKLIFVVEVVHCATVVDQLEAFTIEQRLVRHHELSPDPAHRQCRCVELRQAGRHRCNYEVFPSSARDRQDLPPSQRSGRQPCCAGSFDYPCDRTRNLPRHPERTWIKACSPQVGQQVGKTLNSTLRSSASDRSSAPVPTRLFFAPTPVAMMCPRKPGASNSRRSLT
jgi:hypothetical protein